MKNIPKKILLFGGSGLVGSRIVELLSNSYHIIAPTHQEVDLRDQKTVEKHIEKHSPDFLVYTAGLTSVDSCEKNPKEAELLNAKIPRCIAKRASSLNIPLIYFSTDAVFDGKNYKHPYKENAKPNPISVYGKTKLHGEEYVLGASDKNVIVRIIAVYSATFKKKLDPARKILFRLRKGEGVYGITDQIINPIFVDDVVSSLLLILKKNARGVYHLGSTDYVTNYGFVKKIARHFNLNESLITPVTLREFFKKAPAPRTHYCWLSTKKFAGEFGANSLHNLDKGITFFKKQSEGKRV